MVATTLVDKVLYVVFGHWEFKVVTQYLLKISSVDVVSVTLIKELEAFTGFVLLAALVPSVADDELDKFEIDSMTLENFLISSGLKLLIDFFLGEAVEAEVVEDVSEVGDGDVAVLLLVVKVEGILKVSEDISRKGVRVSSGWVNLGKGDCASGFGGSVSHFGSYKIQL